MRSFGTYLLKLFASTLFLSVLLTLILVITREWFLDYFLEIITDYRGTSHFEGETKTAEFIHILKFFVYPAVLGASFIVALILVKTPQPTGKKPTPVHS
ncbi:MAG: hypothetical protein AAF388_20735 [Bacteroidota bacterium]